MQIIWTADTSVSYVFKYYGRNQGTYIVPPFTFGVSDIWSDRRPLSVFFTTF